MQRATGGRRQSPPPSRSRAPAKGARKESPTTPGSSQYDTKDPFTALSLLRKLLNNTSRHGYKMSPDEHKLSLHLLTIVEPFIGNAPMDQDEARRILTRQPNEILDMIAFHVDSRRDLLALAMTCKRLCDVVLPRHLEYRVIHCKPSSDKVWRHLIAHPLLACNVRQLQVMDDRSRDPEIVPSRAAEEPDIPLAGLEVHKEHQRLIIGALANMSTLASFYWACNNSLISFEDVSPALFTCEMLKEVEISDNQMFSPTPADQLHDQGENIMNRNTPEIPDLMSVAIRTAKTSTRQNKHPSLMRIQGLLISHCPNLTTLRIGYDNRRPFIPLADEFLQQGRWPYLRNLTLQNLWCSTHTGFEAASDFIVAHPLIETLHLDLGRIQLDLPQGSLPKLKELISTREVAASILSCPFVEGESRPLQTLKGFKLGGNKDTILLQSLKQYLGLKRIELQSFVEIEDIKKLADATPKLTSLDVGRRGSAPAKASGPASVNEWANVLSTLPELTELQGVNFFYEVTDGISHSDRSRIKKNDEVASMLAWKCPKLKKVDYIENSGKVVVLGKEGDRLKWEVKRSKM
ncbi:hypothetical protein M422DRAFT_43724 [Sphaerobolus stellatus SS14]|nr:hypothetical protein M422DRAFT_43724 [Sphaerobolus stellatus SS14]